MFRKYYDPKGSSDWTSTLTDDVVGDLRLHLSWELGMDMSTCSKVDVGYHILGRFHKIGILSAYVQAIVDDCKIMDLTI